MKNISTLLFALVTTTFTDASFGLVRFALAAPSDEKTVSFDKYVPLLVAIAQLVKKGSSDQIELFVILTLPIILIYIWEKLRHLQAQRKMG